MSFCYSSNQNIDKIEFFIIILQANTITLETKQFHLYTHTQTKKKGAPSSSLQETSFNPTC